MLSTHEDADMSDFSNSHRRHQEYTYRLPTPPRIVLPPLTLNSAVPGLSVGGAGSRPGEELDINFLKEVNLGDVVRRNTVLEWAYERRRQGQMVLPWLYLGPLPAAKDRDFLAREGITMVLAIRSRQNSMNGAVQNAREVCQEVATIEASDYFSLIGRFSDTTRMINQHVARFHQYTSASGNPQLGKVLVFCESGNEKSAAVVAAYLMEMLNDFDHIKAMQVCQAQRFCVNFDDTIKNMLRSYWDILLARRTVASSRTELLQSRALNDRLREVEPDFQSRHITTKPKRTIEDTRDDEDVEMGDDTDPSDALRFAGRDITPFQDS